MQMRSLLRRAAGFAMLAFATHSIAAIFTVTSTADTNTVGTLRYYINFLNTEMCPSAPHTIAFDLGAGVQTINLANALPAITCSSITIDGYYSPPLPGVAATANTDVGAGNNANLKVILNGTGCAGCDGLTVYGSNVTIQGLSIHSFAGAGIRTSSSLATLLGNYIGTDPGGIAPVPPNAPNGGYGVRVDSGYAIIGTNSNPMHRNLITANPSGGIYVAGPMPSVRDPMQTMREKVLGAYADIGGNQIGGRRDGSTGMGNGGPGIWFAEATSSNNIIGNHIRANAGAGLRIDAGSRVWATTNTFQGNTGLKIDLNGDGVNNCNDPCAPAPSGPPYDGDNGANNLVNYPENISVIQSGGNTFIKAEIKTTAVPTGKAVAFEFYYVKPSGEEAYLAGASCNVDATGFCATPQLGLSGLYTNVSATATHDECGVDCRMTSEFAPAVAATAPAVSITPSPLSFTAIPVGGSSSADVTITNTGTARLLVNSVSAGGSPYFTQANNCPVPPASVAPGANCKATVTYAPLLSGSHSGALTVNTDVTGAGPLSVSLSGTTPPVASLSASSINFGSVNVGSTGSQAMTITNTGGTTLTLGSLSPSGSTAFSVTGCSGASLAPGASCTITTTFTPSSPVAVSSSFGITSNAAGSPHTVSLTGTGVTPPAPAVSIAPSPAAFGNIQVGTQATLAVNVNNTGNANLSINAINISGTPPFSQTNACVGASVAPGASCPITVKLAPTATGAQSGTITISTNAPGSPHSVSLTGTGTAPIVTLAAPSSFGSVPVGSSGTATANLTNTGDAPLSITSIATSGAPFTQTNACPNPLAAGATCAITLSFSPTAPGTFNGQVTVASNAAGSPHSASLTGTGVSPPNASFSTTAVNFGNVNVGSTGSQTITITNTGGTTLILGSLSPPGSTAFSVTGCSGASLAPGASCSINASFMPSSPVAVTSSFGITSNASGSPHIVSLTGTGVAPAISISSTSLNFGNVGVGGSATQTATVTNSGSATLSIGVITVSGSTAFTAGGCSGSTVPPGSSCNLTVTFTPAASGGATASLSISSNANGSPHTVALSGTGTAPAASLAPTPANFGSVVVGTTATLAINLSNTGSAPLSVATISVAGSGFAQTNACTTPVAPGASCQITVTFAPTATGSQTGSLTVTSNASGSPHAVALSGTGTAPGVSLTPSPVNFGNVPLGTTANATLNLSNTGTANLAVQSITLTGPFFSQTNTCPGTLAPGASCPITVAYAPTTAGPHSGQVSVLTNAGTSAVVAPLSGTGTAPTVSLSPSPLSFGSVTVGSTANAALVLSNTGAANLAVQSIALSGAFFSQTNACPATLAPGASCQITVMFSPTATGSQTGSLTVTSNASGSPHAVALSGTGTAPNLSLAPSPLSFGNVPVGTTASSTLVLSNDGTASLTVQSITLSGAFFSQINACPATLAPATSCQVTVTFSPTATGGQTGTLTVTSNASGSPHTVALSGTATASGVALSSASLDFGSQTVGTASLVQTVTVTNNGGAPLNLSAIGVTGDFNFTGCPTPLAVPPGGTCTLSVKFLPTATGTRSGAVSIGSNASGSPHAITLTGNGTPVPVPGIALAPGSATFGAIVVGANSTQVLVLSNPGTAPLAISSIAATGTGFSQTNTCPTSISPSAACNISVKFAPTVTGPASGQLDIVSNAAPSPLVAALSGSGLPATTAGLTLSTTGVSFAPQFIGTTSAPQIVTLTSSGTAPLVISNVAASGDFAFSGCGPSTLAPNATCTYSITFRPQSVGSLTGSIVVTSNASGSPHTLTLSGNGASLTAPEIVMSPSAFAFGTLRPARNATIVGRLTNTGAARLDIAQIQVTGAFFTQSNNCPSTVAVGGFCDITVTYSPTAAGAHSGQLRIQSNAIPSPFVAALSGTGIVVPPPFLTTSGPINFGQQVTGTTVRRTLQLTNTGGDPLVISSMAIVGSGAFGVEGGCGTIAPEASCSLTITFLPIGLVPFNARLDIVSNHSGGAVQVQLSGQGVALPQPDLDFSLGAIGFGPQTLGSRSAGQTVRLTNIGGAPVTISALRSTLPDFQVDASQCIGTLAAGASCDIGVVFNPFRSGPILGSLIVDSSPVQNDSVGLIGVGCRFSLLRGVGAVRLCLP